MCPGEEKEHAGQDGKDEETRFQAALSAGQPGGALERGFEQVADAEPEGIGQATPFAVVRSSPL